MILSEYDVHYVHLPPPPRPPPSSAYELSVSLTLWNHTGFVEWENTAKIELLSYWSREVFVRLFSRMYFYTVCSLPRHKVCKQRWFMWCIVRLSTCMIARPLYWAAVSPLQCSCICRWQCAWVKPQLYRLICDSWDIFVIRIRPKCPVTQNS